MDEPQQPLLFANRVIRQFMDHLVGPDVISLPIDFMIIRLAYRRAGCTWEELSLGNITHVRVLEEIIMAWGTLPDRSKELEVV